MNLYPDRHYTVTLWRGHTAHVETVYGKLLLAIEVMRYSVLWLGKVTAARIVCHETGMTEMDWRI